ncbi:TPA: hypothetical protein EYP37_12930 [Candidatus Poribacteria bacterium]|nr:hypothetical protein [Candidatus Poribacteria bacterium]
MKAEMMEIVEHLRLRNDVVGVFLLSGKVRSRFVAVAQSESQCLEKLWHGMDGDIISFEVVGLRELERMIRTAERNGYVPPEYLSLADAEVLFDTMSILGEAKEKFSELKNRRFRLNESDQRRYRCELSLLLKEIISADQTDLAGEIRIYRLIETALRCYMDLSGIRWTNLDEAIERIRKRDVDLYEKMREAISGGEWERRIAAMEKIVAKVLRPIGGMWRLDEPIAVGRCSRCRESSFCLRSPEDEARRYFRPIL